MLLGWLAVGADSWTWVAGVMNPATQNEELHACAVTEDGRLWHSVRTGPTSWTPFGDVEAQAGAHGPFGAVDCAADGNLLHVVAVSRDGRAWYTIRSVTAWHRGSCRSPQLLHDPVEPANCLAATAFRPEPLEPWTDLIAETGYTEGGSFETASVPWRPLPP
jgi:hypothetical protein